MDDLISRQDAIDAVGNCEPGEELFVIKSLPSIDAVPVIRCKDCEIRYTDRCGMFDIEAEWEWTEDNGFCQYGERKEE